MNPTNETTPAIETAVAEPEMVVSAALVAASEPELVDATPPEAKPKRNRAAKPEPASEGTDAEPKPKHASKKAASAEASADAKTSASTKRTKPTKASSSLPSKGATLEDVASAYIAQIENDGASTSTILGYRAELARALKILGGATLMTDLSADSVKKYMRCKWVTQKRDGSPRDFKTVDRTRRVLRLALVFAEERGIVEHAPIPEKI